MTGSFSWSNCGKLNTLSSPNDFMKITLSDLKKRSNIDCIIIESVDLSIYIAFAKLDGAEVLITKSNGDVLKTFNLLSMQREVLMTPQVEVILRQRSAYDEMGGHCSQSVDNTMELSLKDQSIPDWFN